MQTFPVTLKEKPENSEENGSGKSTLLEALAVAHGFNPEGRHFLSFTKNSMESMLDIRSALCYHEHMESKLSIRKESFMKNRIEELRKERGIKQEVLAAELGVSRQTIGSLENGRYNPSILLAFKIAKYFGRSIEEIFIYEEGTK